MLPSDFHPVLQRWWETRFRDSGGRVLPPTEAQLEGWRAIRSGAHTLIAAPTGSGKTLAAFLTSIDQLLRESLEGRPRRPARAARRGARGLRLAAEGALRGHPQESRRAAPRDAPHRRGDGASSGRGDRRRAQRRHASGGARGDAASSPPHILVTTPESLYLLLTAERSRDMLRTARVVIVDEIHAVLESRRGAHLALSLERLDHVCGRRLQRVGLSATQKPIEEVARFLVGTENSDCAIVDRGHKRHIDLAIEVPGSPLEAVMSLEVWQEIYERLVGLIESHRTTLIFVNTRRLAERMAHQLSERLGAEHVAAHHGSLAKEVRLDAESGSRTASSRCWSRRPRSSSASTSATSISSCQISSPHRIATLLQRVGRSGHTVGGLPKGRLFPLTRDDLVECAAMVRAARDGELDRVIIPGQAARRARAADRRRGRRRGVGRGGAASIASGAPSPYRDLTRAEFDDVVAHARERLHDQRGRRAALVHYDAVNRKLRGRTGSRLTAITLGRRDPRGVRLPRAARARGNLHRHAERGLRDRVAGRRRVPARQRLLAHPAECRTAWCASRTRRGSRRRCRSGWAKRPRAATR